MEREDFRMQGERTVATPKTDNSLPYFVRSRHSHLPQLIPPGLFSRHFQSALQAVRWFAEYEAHPEQREAVVGKFQVRRPSRARGQAPPSRRKPSPPLRCTIASIRVALLCADEPIFLHARPACSPSLFPPQTSLQETATASCPSLQTMAAIIFLKEGLVKDALRAVHRGTTLEQ